MTLNQVRWARLRAAVRGSGQLTEAERQREERMRVLAADMIPLPPSAHVLHAKGN